MESKHHDPVSYFKKIEAEMNKRIHTYTNCRTFTKAFGRGMEEHLKQLRIHKRLTTKWLNHLDLANKDEIAALSVRIVECEEKLDLFDEKIYTIKKKQQENLSEIKMIRELWEEWLAVLVKEQSDIQTNKLNMLEEELLELKQSFYNEFKMEEKYNG